MYYCIIIYYCIDVLLHRGSVDLRSTQRNPSREVRSTCARRSLERNPFREVRSTCARRDTRAEPIQRGSLEMRSTWRSSRIHPERFARRALDMALEQNPSREVRSKCDRRGARAEPIQRGSLDLRSTWRSSQCSIQRALDLRSTPRSSASLQYNVKFRVLSAVLGLY